MLRTLAVRVAALVILAAGLIGSAAAGASGPAAAVTPTAGPVAGPTAAAPAGVPGGAATSAGAATPAGTAAPAEPAAPAQMNKAPDVAAAQVVQDIFGEDLRRAATAAQKVDLAARMLDGARAVQGQPPVAAILCEKAGELGLADPRGYQTVLGAADLLAAKVPEKADVAQEMRVAVRQRQYDQARTPQDRAALGAVLVEAMVSAANGKAHAGRVEEAQRQFSAALVLARALRLPYAVEIEAQQKAASELLRTAARIPALKAQLKAEPTNQAVRDQLVRLLVIDFDNPAEAARYLDGPCDAALLKYVPAAAKGVQAAPELACLELGKWYRELAASAVPASKVAMLARCRAYCERFLELHAVADLDRFAADQILKMVTDELVKLSPATAAPLERNLVLGVWLFRQREGPILDSRRKPVAIQGDWKWAADDAFARPTETVEFRRSASATWPNEPAFQLRAGSITAWVKFATANPMCGIVTKGSQRHDDYSLIIWGGKLGTGMGYPEASLLMTPTTVPPNRGVFLAYAWDDKKAAFWMDGKPAGTIVQATPLTLTDSPLGIANNSPGDPEYFVGRMAGVHIYNATVTDKQVQDQMRYEAQYMKLRLAPADGAPR